MAVTVLLHHVFGGQPDVSEEHINPIFRVEKRTKQKNQQKTVVSLGFLLGLLYFDLSRITRLYNS
jgi:hypothetical protein